MKKKLTKYWMKHYLSETHLCSLCGNHGIIDTRGVLSPAVIEVGRLNWCICPNGQALRKHSSKDYPSEAFTRIYDGLKTCQRTINQEIKT
jgi:hypothetical protein